MSKQTKAQLKAALVAANIAFKANATHAVLSAALAAHNTVSTVRKQRVSTKQILRNLFPNVGDTMLVTACVTAVQEQANVQAATIVTMLGDLRNSKYAAGVVIDIARVGDSYTRNS